jgi:hypothetical protein
MGCNCGGRRTNAVTTYEVWKDGKKLFESTSKAEAVQQQTLAGAGALLKPITGQ